MENKWISVKDELPEPGFPILFYSKSYGVSKGIRSYGSTKVMWFQFGSNRCKDVTHWMPLPEPPTEL